MSPRVVYLPPDLADGVHRRNGGEPEYLDTEPEPREPGMFPTVGGLLAALALAGTALTVFALGVWKLAELIARALA